MISAESFNRLIQTIVGSAAVVKVGVFFLVWLLAWLPIAVPLAIRLKWQPPNPPTIAQKIPLVLSLYVLAPLILWGFASSERRSFAVYGLAFSPSVLLSLMVGLLLGVLGVGLLFGLEYWLGWLTWQQTQVNQLFSTVVSTLVVGLFISTVEELVFRGFLLNQLQHDYTIAIAAISTSIIFALLHLIWEGTAIASQLPGLWLMGMVLVLARWADGGSLGLACGLHAGWIWGMASLDSAQLIHYSDRAPIWMIGLKKQPLAGGMGLLLLLITGGVVWGLRTRLAV